MNKPSSCGLSFAVSSDDIPSVKVCADFALYVPEIGEKKKKTEPADSGKSKYNDIIWRRRPIRVDVPVNLEYGIQRSPLNSLYKDCPDDVFLYIRVISWEGNKRLATITLVNDIKPEKSLMQIGTEMATLFQVSVTINPAEGTELIARPSGRGGDLRSGDRDDRIAALLYRDYHEFATGHTCSAAWDPESSNRKAEWIATAWIPEAIVPSTSSSGHHLFNSLKDGRDLRPLSAEWLSHASDRDLKSALLLLPDIYEKWLVLQDQKAGDLQGMYQSQASENLAICRGVLQRIREGAEIIADNPEMADTFRLVNRAIVIQYGWSKKQKESFFWRPFQLAFLLLTIPSTIHNDHPDRNIMDLLWFPTGGGKTEAYLALVAFTIIHRRIGSKNGPDSAAGVAAIMRYTLRLLTTQQFSRSASVILACEMIRRGKDRETPPEVYRKLGDRPISIGLWVGGERHQIISMMPGRLWNLEIRMRPLNSLRSALHVKRSLYGVLI